MATQVPSVKRFGPQAPVAEQPINVPQVDTGRAFEVGSKVVGQLTDQAIDLYNQIEDRQIDRDTTQYVEVFETAYRARLAEVKKTEGDPTELYRALDEDMKTLRQKVEKDASEKLNGRGVAVMKEKLDKAYKSVAINRAQAQATQTAAYEARQTAASIRLRQEAILQEAEYVSAKDDTSFAPLANQVNELKNIRLKNARENGLISEDGKISDILDMQIKQDVSEALGRVVESLNVANRPAEAEKILERYKDDMLPSTRAKLMKQNQESGKKVEALAIVNQVKDLSPDDAFAKLSSLTKDPEVLEKAEGFLDAHTRRRTMAEERSSNTAFEAVMAQVQARQLDPSSGNPFVSVLDVENDAALGKHWARMKPKQREAIAKMIDAPKNSSDDVKIELYGMIENGQLGDLEPAKAMEQFASLNPKDRRFFESAWRDARQESDTEAAQRDTRMSSQLKEQLIANRIIKTGFGNRRMSKQDQMKLLEYQEKLRETYLQNRKTPLTVDQQIKFVKQFVAAQAAGIEFTPPTPTPAPVSEPRTGRTPAPRTARPAKRPYSELSQTEKMSLIQRYAESKGKKLNQISIGAELNDIKSFYESE